MNCAIIQNNVVPEFNGWTAIVSRSFSRVFEEIQKVIASELPFTVLA